MAELAERFWSKVKRDPEGCWEWQGCRHHQWRYGHFTVDGKVKAAHRLVWEFTEGPIPEGLLVCHTCDNPPCVRPSHLFLGTAKDNAVDMVRKGRWRSGDRSGEKNVSAKITRAIAEAIRSSPKLGIELASEYGISKSLVSLIRLGKRWA